MRHHLLHFAPQLYRIRHTVRRHTLLHENLTQLGAELSNSCKINHLAANLVLNLSSQSILHVL